MLVIAKSQKGAEFMYNPSTAHKVSKRSCEQIKKVLNECNYQLKDGETWFIHECDRYDTAYDFAQFQRFSIYKGVVKDHRY